MNRYELPNALQTTKRAKADRQCIDPAKRKNTSNGRSYDVPAPPPEVVTLVLLDALAFFRMLDELS